MAFILLVIRIALLDQVPPDNITSDTSGSDLCKPMIDIKKLRYLISIWVPNPPFVTQNHRFGTAHGEILWIIDWRY
jgi:hypothetical protein